jgi:hypothetical protein
MLSKVKFILNLIFFKLFTNNELKDKHFTQQLFKKIYNKRKFSLICVIEVLFTYKLNVDSFVSCRNRVLVEDHFFFLAGESLRPLVVLLTLIGTVLLPLKVLYFSIFKDVHIWSSIFLNAGLYIHVERFYVKTSPKCCQVLSQKKLIRLIWFYYCPFVQ